MTAPLTQSLRSDYLAACTLDVMAFKPGNVSLRSPGHGMQAEDFLRSAEQSAGPLCTPGLPLGDRVRRAVTATRAVLGCNTNLGILLLCAPVIQARLDHPDMPLDRGVRAVLEATTRADTEAVFAAIRLAAPGGLGRRARHDVSGPAELPLKATMALAAETDFIARQYATSFREVFEDLLPYLRAALQGLGDRNEAAVTDLYLYTLACFGDSHVWRKHGEAGVDRVRRLAAETRVRVRRAVEPAHADRALAALDRALKEAGINPGTSADLCVATYLIHRLQSQVGKPVGATRHEPRTGRHPDARAPHLTTSR